MEVAVDVDLRGASLSDRVDGVLRTTLVGPRCLVTTPSTRDSSNLDQRPPPASCVRYESKAPPQDAELRTDEPLDVLVEGLHETRKNGLENDLHDRLAGRRHAEHVVVPREARRDDGTPTPGRSSSREEHRVCYILPEQLVSIVEALEVEELSEELYWRLSTVGLDLRGASLSDRVLMTT